MEREKREQFKLEVGPVDKRMLESIEIIKAAEPEISFRGSRGEVPTYEFGGKAEELGELINRMKNILLRDDQGLKKALGEELLSEVEQKVKNFRKSLIDYERALITGKTEGVAIGHFKTIHPLVKEIYLPGRLIEIPSVEEIYQAHIKRLNELAKSDSLFRDAPGFEEFKDKYPQHSERSVFDRNLWIAKLCTRQFGPKKGKFSLIISYQDKLSCEVPEVNQKVIKRMNEIFWEVIDKQGD